MSRSSIPRTKRKVKRVAKAKPRKKSPAKAAKKATKKRVKAQPKKAKRIRVSTPKKPVKAKPVKRSPAKTKKVPKRQSMNIHTRKPAKKPVKKPAKKKSKARPRKTKREKELELAVSALRKMIPAALIHSMVTESVPPKFAPLEERISQDEIDSVTKILEEDLAPEPSSDHTWIPIQPSIVDNMSPGVQKAIQLVSQYGTRLRNLDPEKLAFWQERSRTVRMIYDVTGIWDEGGNEREYMEAMAEQQGKRTRAVYTDLLSPGDLEEIFAEPTAAE